MKLVQTYITVPDYNDCYVKFRIMNTEYQLRFSWNDSEQRWYFGIYDALRNPMFIGMKIVPWMPLNQFCGIEELYRFAFIAQTKNDAIGREDFVNGSASIVCALLEDDR